MNTPRTDAPADGAAPGDRRGAEDALTAEELALIASCGERIRRSDWEAIRRARLKSGAADAGSGALPEGDVDHHLAGERLELPSQLVR